MTYSRDVVGYDIRAAVIPAATPGKLNADVTILHACPNGDLYQTDHGSGVRALSCLANYFLAFPFVILACSGGVDQAKPISSE